MLKLIVIGTLLCASQNENNAVRNVTVAREVKLWLWDSITVAIEPHLFTIAKNWTHLFVNSTDPNVKPCTVDLEEHTFQQRIEATTIGRKIVVWGIRTRYETRLGDRIDHTVLIVDPWQCSFKVAPTFEEERPSGWWWNENLARVVAHNDSFDVFYPSLQTCAPCRYSIGGKRIDVQYQLQANHTLDGANTFFRIQSYSVPGHEKRYFYAQNIGMESSVIKILDDNFRVVKHRYLKHRVDTIAANPYGPSNLYVCSTRKRGGNDTRRIYCEQFDSDLELSNTIRLPMFEGHSPDAFSMNVDASGDLFIPVVQSYSDITKFGYYWVSSSGQLIDDATIYQLPPDTHGEWDIRGFFADNKYCIENSDYYGWQAGKHEFVKCVIIPKIFNGLD